MVGFRGYALIWGAIKTAVKNPESLDIFAYPLMECFTIAVMLTRLRQLMVSCPSFPRLATESHHYIAIQP